MQTLPLLNDAPFERPVGFAIENARTTDLCATFNRVCIGSGFLKNDPPNRETSESLSGIKDIHYRCHQKKRDRQLNEAPFLIMAPISSLKNQDRIVETAPSFDGPII